MIIVDWGNFEETLLVMKFEYKWQLDEQQAAFDKVMAMVHDKPPNIVVMIDMQRATRYPRGFLHMCYQYAKMQSNNIVASIVISKSTLWQKLWQAAIHMYGYVHNVNLIFVDNTYRAYDIAEAYLKTGNGK